jgi:HAD superfamily hydrolase (TIGR01490 family)
LPPRGCVRSETVAAAAFFDLDRTLLRRSSALALAGTFRERGMISRRQLASAAAWQLLFVARGASHESVRRAAEDGLRVLDGHTPDELRGLVAEAMEPVLRPLLYAEPLQLVEQHRARGDRVYIVSATLQEIVQAIADDLGFDGALGTVCEVQAGRYTGRALRALHAENKAASVRELAAAEGLDLSACTAYSDSHTDLPFLEAVGHPVVVNPDRELRAAAADRGWPVLEFSGRAYPHAGRRLPSRLLGRGLVAGALVAAAALARKRGR